MAITQAICTQFKVDLMKGLHNFTTSTGNSFKAALYNSSTATLSASTSAYTTTGEVTGTAYSAGGQVLTNVTPTNPSGTTAITDFADVTWSTSTITAGGAMIYNDTHATDGSVMILNFGSDKASSAGDFTIVFPAADISNAIIRIA
jgi:hypothetical protein